MSPFPHIDSGILPFGQLHTVGWAAEYPFILFPVRPAAAALDTDPFAEYLDQLDRTLPVFLRQPALHEAFLPHTDRGIHSAVVTGFRFDGQSGDCPDGGVPVCADTGSACVDPPLRRQPHISRPRFLTKPAFSLSESTQNNRSAS